MTTPLTGLPKGLRRTLAKLLAAPAEEDGPATVVVFVIEGDQVRSFAGGCICDTCVAAVQHGLDRLKTRAGETYDLGEGPLQ